MAISAKQVKALRDKTGAGMMDCKKALVETDGDVDKAVEYLQIKGLAASAKREDRDANEGVIALIVSDDGRAGALVEVNCETDFVARNSDFQAFVDRITTHARDNAPANRDAWLAQTIEGKTVDEFVRENASTLGENIVVGRMGFFAVGGAGAIGGYIHHDKKTGVMVQIDTSTEDAASSDAVATLTKQLAMHIAASKPEAVSSESVDANEIAKQRAIFEAQGLETGKPANIVEKIAEGRLRKWLKEICLLDQPFVMDSDLTVAQLLKKTSKELGAEVNIARFTRIVIGS